MTPHCSWGDAVLAHFLDGEVTPSPAPPSSELAAHLDSCAPCQDLLARARRLDAVLASTSRPEPDRDTTDRLLAAVEAEIAPRQPVPEPAAPASAVRRWAPRLALLACGFAAAVLWQGLGSEPAPAELAPRTAQRQEAPATATDTAGADAAVASAPGRVVLPHVAATRSPRPRRPAARPRAASVRELQRLALRRDLAQDLLPMAVLRAIALGAPLREAPADTAARIAARVRIDAAAQLARSPDPRAAAALARVIAAEPPGAPLEEMVGRARAAGVSDRLRGSLHAGDPDASVLALAAVLGEPRLDAALLQAVEGDVESTDRVVQASQRVFERPGRVALLLKMWADLQTRGLERSTATGAEATTETAAEARARAWFGGLPAAATHELVAEARRTRRTEQRERCLLALAARADPAAIDYLLELVQGPRYHEGELAAHALGQCPADVMAPRVRDALRRARHPELLLAALASARFTGLASWLGDLDLSTEEKRFLLAGSFHREQFRIAACLIRNRRAEPAF